METGAQAEACGYQILSCLRVGRRPR